MSQALLAGSAAAAFAAGLVAFFAPCCSGVMVPTYLAAVGGGSRWRVARATALYVAGVAAVVWPITLGASALSSLVSRWHGALFLTGGALMLLVAAALWRGTMLALPLPQPELSGTALSVFGLGAFSGAASACCAPVLTGAAALSVASGAWWGGALLGGTYILGLVAPLLPLAFLFGRLRGRLRGRVRDPKLTLRLGRYAKRTTVSRLVGSALFSALGALFIALALTGNAETVPGFQRTLGGWLAGAPSRLGDVPDALAWPLLAAVAIVLAYVVLKPSTREESHEQQAVSSRPRAQAPPAPTGNAPALPGAGRGRGRARRARRLLRRAAGLVEQGRA